MGSASNNSSTSTEQQNQPAKQTKDLNLAVEQTTQQQGNSAEQVQIVTKEQVAILASEIEGITEEIRTINISEINLPNSALYKFNSDSKAGYLVETDPDFANYKS